MAETFLDIVMGQEEGRHDDPDMSPAGLLYQNPYHNFWEMLGDPDGATIYVEMLVKRITNARVSGAPGVRCGCGRAGERRACRAVHGPTSCGNTTARRRFAYFVRVPQSR
jgi:hypothetical protein